MQNKQVALPDGTNKMLNDLQRKIKGEKDRRMGFELTHLSD